MWIIWYIRRLQSCTQLSHIIFIFLRKETANIAHTDMPDQLWAQPGSLTSSSAIAQPSTAAFAQHNRELEGDRQNHINTKCQGDLNPQYTSRHYFRCSNGDRDTLFVERFDFCFVVLLQEEFSKLGIKNWQTQSSSAWVMGCHASWDHCQIYPSPLPFLDIFHWTISPPLKILVQVIKLTIPFSRHLETHLVWRKYEKYISSWIYPIRLIFLVFFFFVCFFNSLLCWYTQDLLWTRCLHKFFPKVLFVYICSFSQISPLEQITALPVELLHFFETDCQHLDFTSEFWV